jgi:hypothetical protein
MKLRELHTWFGSFEACTSLAEIEARWHEVLEAHGLRPMNEDGVFPDAVLSFLARSRLQCPLKLAIILGFVDGTDLDPRIAFGALNVRFETECSDDLESFAEDTGRRYEDRLTLSGGDAWLLGYINGRYAEVSHSILRENHNVSDWRTRFWNMFLTMSCRWCDRAGVELALSRGATPVYDDFAPVRAACEGTGAEFGRAYYVEGRADDEYWSVVERLMQQGYDIASIEAHGLEAAASAGNLIILEHLVDIGADVNAAGGSALTAAAAYGMCEVVDWLLLRGAKVHASNDAALIAAVSSLSEESVESLFCAGANVSAGSELALLTAFSTMPGHLYGGDCHDFISQRADMTELLLEAGARLQDMPLTDEVVNAPYLSKIMSRLMQSSTIPLEAKAALETFVKAIGPCGVK